MKQLDIAINRLIDICIGQLVRFTLWIFDNKQEHIVPSVLQTFIDANERDIKAHATLVVEWKDNV